MTMAEKKRWQKLLFASIIALRNFRFRCTLLIQIQAKLLEWNFACWDLIRTRHPIIFFELRFSKSRSRLSYFALKHFTKSDVVVSAKWIQNTMREAYEEQEGNSTGSWQRESVDVGLRVYMWVCVCVCGCGCASVCVSKEETETLKPPGWMVGKPGMQKSAQFFVYIFFQLAALFMPWQPKHIKATYCGSAFYRKDINQLTC